MLSQTNLALYGQMMSAGWTDDALVRARAAYDLARSLFSNAYRPSHKPFVCHLIGTASAAVSWDAPEPVVLAGLLHSAYLYGDFGDGERGVTPRRRRCVEQAVGPEAEELVLRYSTQQGRADRAVRLVRLADRLDELADGGPLVARDKGVDGLVHDRSSRQRCLDEASELVGPVAVAAFRDAFATLDELSVPAGLASQHKSYHRVEPGRLSTSRGKLGQRWARAKQSITKRWAA